MNISIYMHHTLIIEKCGTAHNELKIHIKRYSTQEIPIDVIDLLNDPKNNLVRAPELDVHGLWFFIRYDKDTLGCNLLYDVVQKFLALGWYVTLTNPYNISLLQRDAC